MSEDRSKPESENGVAIQAPVVNNLEHAPTIFIEGAQGMMTVNGVVKINLFQVLQKFSPDGSTSEERRVIVARLAMAPPTLISIMEWLGENVKYEKVVEAQSSETADGDGQPG